ncbi:threonine synthase [Vallitalea maricola]|uniref:Threonine synthase n=1 Tax=Vallitalea maricola TaxID=3074433 RepID=A0ACB5UK90_9FIRM|nr:threonine synthase [Vallitalea sp. AN17-2]
MKFVKNYRCTLCGREYSKDEKIYTCPECGEKGILDVEYDYEGLKKVLTKSYFEHNRDYSMWRYKDVMSIREEDIDKTLKVGWTPLYRSNNLEEKIGIKELYIKDEGLNPTASLKDRASAVAVIKALENNADTIACSSTGNAASSLAGNAARLGLSTVIFVPERAPQGKLAQLLIYGAKVISVKGDYRETFKLSKEAIDHWGWYNRNAAINPHLVEGKKTVAIEIAEQLGWQVPDWVAVSVGDGCTIGGVYRGFYDLLNIGLINRIPKILGVQAKGCCPFYTAYTENEPLKPTDENTIADSISVGIPRNPVKAMRAVEDSKGTWITVSDEAILEAMKTLGSSEGIFGEPAGVAGLAGVIRAVKEGIITKDETVSVIITGNGLKDVKNALKAAGNKIECKPDIEQLKRYLT